MSNPSAIRSLSGELSRLGNSLIAILVCAAACSCEDSSSTPAGPSQPTGGTLSAGLSTNTTVLTGGQTAQTSGTTGQRIPDVGAPTSAVDASAVDASAVDASVPNNKVEGGAPVDAAVVKDASLDAKAVPGSDAGTDAGDDGPLNTAPVTFGTNIKVSDDTGRVQQTEVAMAARKDGLVFAGWMDDRTSPRSCAYSVSKDGGKTWGTNFFTTTQEGGFLAFAGDPTVAIDDAGNLYAGCQDYASGGLGTNYVLFAYSKDDGETWSEFTRVNQSLDKPWLGGTQDGTVLLSWLGNPGGVKRSTDYGVTWSDPISLGYINHGTILATSENGFVHMAYNTDEDTVTYRRSKDYGVTFEAARDLSSQGTACYSPCSPRSHPIIGGGTDPTGRAVVITWASRLTHPDSEGDDDVWVIVSYDSGDTFTDPIRVNDNLNASRQFQPWAAADKYGAVHVVWTDLRDGGQNATYYARMVDPEVGFEDNVEVTDATGAPESFLGDFKGIAVQGRDVIVTWTDTRNDSGDIYFARAVDAAAAGGPLAQ